MRVYSGETGACDDRSAELPGGCRSFPGGGVTKDDEIRAHFDGRGRVELLPGHAAASQQRCIGDIAHAIGYRLLATQTFGRVGIRLIYERDDAPPARRRAEQTRRRAGSPALPALVPRP
jgi:hypothetical protein